MSRSKSISDEDVLDRLGEFLARSGPDALSFAGAAMACGLSAPTLVQRFASREGLMRAVLLRMWDRLDVLTAELDGSASLDAPGALDMLLALSGDHESDDPGQGLLLLREDLRDPVLRARGAAWSATMARALGRRIAADFEQRERMGRLMFSQWQGIVLWWGFAREGSMRDAVRHGLSEWLAVLKELAAPDRDSEPRKEQVG